MFVGIDGCKSGWVVAAGTAPNPTIQILPDIHTIWETFGYATRILIDIPIGFPDTGERACEATARAMLQERRSSVFMVPVRPALYANTYSEASTMNHGYTGKKLSRQTWNIMPKMREVDQFLQATPQARILESHPEVVFTALAGHPMQHPKKRGLGFFERVQVLAWFIPDVAALIEETLEKHKRAAVEDDVVDALALWVAAGMDDLRTLPDEPPHDAHGIPMQIVYPVVRPVIQHMNHVQITIPTGQEAAARTFYRNVLGLQEIEKPESLRGRGGFWLQVGDQQVHIGTEDGFDRRTTKGNIAYQVGNISMWRARIMAAGVTILESVPIPGYDRFEFRDPFGNRVEIIAPLRNS